MVHEGVRKKCEICNKVLSDLNKHMRTVHGTYRRRAKIPKDLISEIDNPNSELLPQIYGASSSSPEKSYSPPTIPAAKQNIPKPAPRPTKRKAPASKETPAKNNNYEVEQDNDTQSIKAELGLSSGITLQKIVRPSPVKAPPKLTYHGPSTGLPPMANHFGSIEITPLTQGEQSQEGSSNHNIPRLVKKPDPSSMVKISGKYSKNMPELVNRREDGLSELFDYKNVVPKVEKV